MRLRFIPTAAALVAFVVFLLFYDIPLASEESKAHAMLFCAALFFGASIVSRSRRSPFRDISETVGILATLMVASLVLFSLPIQLSGWSILPRQTATFSNSSNGTLFGPLAKITIDMLNARIAFESWNRSEYNVSYEITARGLTRRSARRVLDETEVTINDYGGDLVILLGGPDRFRRRISIHLTIMIPRSVTPVLALTATNGTLNLTGPTFDSVDAWVGSGEITARHLQARACEILVDNGPIDLETESESLNLRTIGGDIRVVSLAPEIQVAAESVNGRIETYLNYSGDVGYSIEANSLGGSISVNLTGVVFVKQRSGFVLAKTKDFNEREFQTTVVASTTAGNITVSQI